MTTSSSQSGPSILRTQIETNVPNPGLIVLTSARVDDGCPLAASTIADCLATAGHRVALLVTENLDLSAFSSRPNFSVDLLSTKLDAGRPLDVIAEFAVKTRRDYDFTIVAAQPLPGDVASVMLASCANAVFISIRIGRLACAEDNSLNRALKRAEARVFGVIGVSESSINSFGRIGAQSASFGERKSRTQTTSRNSPSRATAK